MSDRTAVFERKTLETEIEVRVDLEGTGRGELQTGLPFLDHMLSALARHGRIDLRLSCRGDLHVDDHHSVEDSAIALGTAIDRALGDRAGIARFGYAYAPLDEALARAVVDLSGRPHAEIDLGLKRDAIGALACENLGHFLRSLAMSSRSCIHLDVLKGSNDHHRAEAAFKALGLALRQAFGRGTGHEIPSTKGVIG
jgi:imidazoleglycerol phosphate dehydratase HisB